MGLTDVEIAMVVLGVFVLLMLCLILGLCQSWSKTREHSSPSLTRDDVTLLQPGSGQVTPSRMSPGAIQRMHGRSEALNSLASFKLVQTDQQKLDDLLKMRAMCDDDDDDEAYFDPHTESERMSNSMGFGRVNLTSPWQSYPTGYAAAGQQNRAQAVRSRRVADRFGLDDDEEELVQELNALVPPRNFQTSISNQASLRHESYGIDRDAGLGGERMFSERLPTSSTPTPSPKRLTSFQQEDRSTYQDDSLPVSNVNKSSRRRENHSRTSSKAGGVSRNPAVSQLTFESTDPYDPSTAMELPQLRVRPKYASSWSSSPPSTESYRSQKDRGKRQDANLSRRAPNSSGTWIGASSGVTVGAGERPHSRGPPVIAPFVASSSSDEDSEVESRGPTPTVML